jgi:hypothetical protein
MTMTSQNIDLDIYVYPNKSKHDSYAETAQSALSGFGDELLSNGICDDVSVTLRDGEHPSLDTFLGKWKMLDKWQNYDGSMNKSSEPGAHLLVGGADWGGKAETRSGNSDFGWQESGDAIIGWDESSEAHYKNLAIHEVGHIIIDEGISDVSQMIEEDEHDLGTHTIAFYEATPMCTSYTDAAKQGQCSTLAPENYEGDYTTDLSDCTIDALDYTTDEI